MSRLESSQGLESLTRVYNIQELKARVISWCLTARLKPCPDTKIEVETPKSSANY
jgi:hypothetical protein